MPTLDEDILRDLMHRSTEDVHARRDAASSIVAQRRRTHRRLVVGTAATGALAVAATGAALFAPSPVVSPGTSGRNPAAATRGTSLLYQLASASAAVPALSGRYVVLSETDTETGYAGESKRTTVEDTQTGASTTYQAAFPVNGVAPSSSYTSEPAVLTEGHTQANAAFYAGLPTDPTELRGMLLRMAQQEEAAANAAMQAKPGAVGTEPTLTDDDNVYQEADEQLWNPLVGPALRSALYKVLAATPGVTVTDNATDPSGQAAIEMQRTYTPYGYGSGTPQSGGPETETTITYEDPATGEVLAQVWSTNQDVITAVYQPITSTNTIPPDPYTS
jgi:hypothetical protein